MQSYDKIRREHSVQRFARAFKWGAVAAGGVGLMYAANKIGFHPTAIKYSAAATSLVSTVMALKNAIIGVGHERGCFDDYYLDMSPRVDSEIGKLKVALGLDH